MNKQSKLLTIVVPDNQKIVKMVNDNIGIIFNGVGLWVPIEQRVNIANDIILLVIDTIGYTIVSKVVEIGTRSVIPTDIPLSHDIECYIFDAAYNTSEEILYKYLRGQMEAKVDLGNAMSDLIRNNIFYLYREGIVQVITGINSSGNSGAIILDATYKIREGSILVNTTLI